MNNDVTDSIRIPKRKIVDNIFVVLRKMDFKKSGSNFNLKRNDLLYFLQMQYSQSSTAKSCKFTINVGITSLQLCKIEKIDKPNYLDSHWTKRIGFFLDQPTDKWWTVDDFETVEKATKEIITLLENKVFPEVFAFSNTRDLESFWLNGKSQGLTEKQREYYLNLLGH